MDEIREQVREFSAAKRDAGGRLELCLSVNGHMEESDIQDFVSQGVKAFRATNSEEVSLNIVSVLSSASGDFALILGDDDCVKSTSILALLRWIDANQHLYRVAVLPVVADTSSESARTGEKHLSPSQALMRFANLPGLLIHPEAASSKPFLDWLPHHIRDIYPQVALCAFYAQAGKVCQIAGEVASVRVGSGTGLISAYTNRFPDYGCLERLTQASVFLRGNLFKHLEFIRFQVNLAWWVSSALRTCDGPDEEDFAKLITEGIIANCKRFRVFAALFRLRSQF